MHSRIYLRSTIQNLIMPTKCINKLTLVLDLKREGRGLPLQSFKKMLTSSDLIHFQSSTLAEYQLWEDHRIWTMLDWSWSSITKVINKKEIVQHAYLSWHDAHLQDHLIQFPPRSRHPIHKLPYRENLFHWLDACARARDTSICTLWCINSEYHLLLP